MHDYYRILQVSREAEPEVIVAAYRALAMKYHPDRHQAADAGEKMKLLNEAYAVIGNKNRRAEFDNSFRSSAEPADHRRQAKQSEDFDFNDFFRSQSSSNDENLYSGFDISGLYYEKRDEKFICFRFYIDGLVLIKTVPANSDGSMPKIRIDRMLGDSFDFSGSYWLSQGMISFEAYSESGLTSYTGSVCGREITLTSYLHPTKETRTFTLQKK